MQVGIGQGCNHKHAIVVAGERLSIVAYHAIRLGIEVAHGELAFQQTRCPVRVGACCIEGRDQPYGWLQGSTSQSSGP